MKNKSFNLKQPEYCKGFTLLEIVIALAIIALIFTGLFSVFNTALGVADDVKRAENLDQTARAILLQINNDLRSFYTANSGSAKKNKQEQVKIAKTEFQAKKFIPEKTGEQMLLAFYSGSSLDFTKYYPRLRVNRIIYALKIPRNRDNNPYSRADTLYSLMRKEIPFAIEGLNQETKIFEMASNIVSCNFSYQKNQGQEQQSWNSTEQEKTTPDMVKVELVLRGQQGHEKTYNFNIDMHR